MKRFFKSMLWQDWLILVAIILFLVIILLDVIAQSAQDEREQSREVIALQQEWIELTSPVGHSVFVRTAHLGGFATVSAKERELDRRVDPDLRRETGVLVMGHTYYVAETKEEIFELLKRTKTGSSLIEDED